MKASERGGLSPGITFCKSTDFFFRLKLNPPCRLLSECIGQPCSEPDRMCRSLCSVVQRKVLRYVHYFGAGSRHQPRPSCHQATAGGSSVPLDLMHPGTIKGGDVTTTGMCAGYRAALKHFTEKDNCHHKAVGHMP